MSLDALFAEIRSVRDCESVRALLHDVYSLSQRDGESAAPTARAAVLSGVREYARRERGLAAMRGDATAGKVLGERPLPIGGEWWGLLADGRAVPAGDKRSGGAAYWCADGSGWWRVSAKESQAGRAA